MRLQINCKPRQTSGALHAEGSLILDERRRYPIWCLGRSMTGRSCGGWTKGGRRCCIPQLNSRQVAPDAQRVGAASVACRAGLSPGRYLRCGERASVRSGRLLAAETEDAVRRCQAAGRFAASTLTFDGSL